LHSHLQSGQNKNIHIVLKAGHSTEPQVLQGVFSGVSTAGDPIAGREIFIRQKLSYDKLTTERASIKDLIGSKSRESELIGKYFKNKEYNILKGGAASTFGLDDLVRE
jgi:hypothetical protein